jgi:hypothetical protein
MRDEYAARENTLETHVYTIRNGVEPDYSQFGEFMTLPSEFPRLGNNVQYFHIINLDQEVLTDDHGIHLALSHFLRHDDLWIRAVADGIYEAGLLSFLTPTWKSVWSRRLWILPGENSIGYDLRVVTPKTELAEARKAFLTHILANTLVEYKKEIISFGLDWSPDSLPFRELAFALVSIASGQASFHSFPAQQCNPPDCRWQWTGCGSEHLTKSPGWLDKKWANDSAPLLEFGSLSHRPVDTPGASPTETMYWLEDVLVSLILVVDSQAITKAVCWGIEQGHANFQIVILSLFEAAFAEVSLGDDEKPIVHVSDAVHLSPLHADYCISTYPRLRLETKPVMKSRHRRGELIMDSARSRRSLQSQFPGLAALVSFFKVAGTRRAASNSEDIFPWELYDLILDFVDYDTWKTCLLVSTTVRSLCLRKYRLDDRTRIVAGPFARVRGFNKSRVLSFDFENMETGKIFPMMWVPHSFRTEQYNWMPIIGHDH